MEISLSRRQKNIIQHLLKKEYFQSATFIANAFELSERTIRNEITFINQCVPNNWHIEMKKGSGYLIRDKLVWTTFMASQKELEVRRDLYILKEVVTKGEVDYYELADTLYISASTVTKEIKCLNECIARAFPHTQIERKNNVLFLPVHDEYKRRILSFFLLDEIQDNHLDLQVLSNYFAYIDIEKLRDVLIAYVEEKQQQIPDYILMTILVHIAIIIDSALIKKNHYSIYEALSDTSLSTHSSLCLAINDLIGSALSSKDIRDIEELLKTMIGKDEKIVDERYVAFLEQLLTEIKENYSVDFSGYEELKKDLSIHFQELEIRCKENKFLKNPLLSEIKRQYTLVYDISVYIAIRFQEQMHYLINEDEIGYIALHILSALEKFERIQLRIAIVNPYSKMITKMIKKELSKSFQEVKFEFVGNYSAFHHQKMYQDHPDLIIALVPIESFGVPVCMVKHHFSDADLENIVHMVNELKMNKTFETFVIRNYFSEPLFFAGLKAKNKDEVLRVMSEKLKALDYVDGDFLASVQEREQVAPTCFGSKYAIPHPAKKIAKKNAVAVAILEHPIPWEGYEVQMVFLFALHQSFNQIPKLYDLLTVALDDSLQFAEIVKLRDFNRFIEMII